MTVREIIHLPDPLLKQVSQPIDDISPELLSVLDDMMETMYDAPGIGLAGIQIALPLRVLTVDCGIPEEEEAELQAEIEWEKKVQAAEAAGEEPPPPRKKKERSKNPITMINPKIVKFSAEPSTYEEGCLSIPDYYADVERPAGCIVEYVDRKGELNTLEADGLLSTCIQHEIDHLDGILFIDHISKLKREMVIKKYTKIAKQYDKENASPLML